MKNSQEKAEKWKCSFQFASSFISVALREKEIVKAFLKFITFSILFDKRHGKNFPKQQNILEEVLMGLNTETVQTIVELDFSIFFLELVIQPQKPWVNSEIN